MWVRMFAPRPEGSRRTAMRQAPAPPHARADPMDPADPHRSRTPSGESPSSRSPKERAARLEELLSEFLLDELGFRRLALDRCRFLLVVGTLRVIIVLYVDDMLIMGDQSLQAQVVERIRSKFKVTEGGCDFLGLHIEHDLGEARSRSTSRRSRRHS